MIRTTPGELLINRALPEGLRRHGRVLDSAGIKDLFQELAEKHPDQYRDVAAKLVRLAGDFAFEKGGLSFGVRHLRPARAALLRRMKIRREIDAILDEGGPDESAREKKILDLLESHRAPLEKEVFDESLAEDNPLARQVVSGVRGNKTNLRSLRGMDLTYVDHRDRAIPIPILRSYSEGLSPAEYWAGAYGARKGVIDVKDATAQVGFLGKQLTAAAHKLIATARDSDEPDETASLRGMPADASDPDNVGALLARAAGGYPRNTVITPRVLKDLQDKGVTRMLVRSPIVGGPAGGGVYARDVGVREKGKLPPVGDYVGHAAAQALSEKLSQGSLCLAVDTKVRMADFSVREIRDIRPGDMVLGANKAGETFPTRVVAVHDNGPQPLRRTTFRWGMTKGFVSIDSTADHKILCVINKWSQKAQALNGTLQVKEIGYKTKDFSAVAAGTFISDVGLDSEPFDLAVGIGLGDGCHTDSVHGAHLSCWDPSLVDDLLPELEPLNLKLTKLAGHVGYYRFSQIDETAPLQDATTGRFCGSYRNPMMQYLASHGMLGKYAHEKEIPDDAYRWSNRSIGRLLGGLCVTDGSVYVSEQMAARSKPYVGFGSTSRRMAEQYRELLADRFGIYSTPLHENKKNRKRSLWQTTISTHDGIRRFAANIPLFGVKRGRLQGHLDLWKVTRPMRHFRCNRVAATELGTHPTLDLEVDHPDHLFVLANGLIVSNSSKHSGGVAGAGGAVSGFKAVERMVNPPKAFPGAAAHAQVDGRVTAVEDAPQGGRYVWIGPEKHYVPPGFEATAKVGDEVEAGDVLSEGVPNPAEIVRHKGVGEGRRYFVDAMRDVYKRSGMQAHRRNIEILARGLVDHVTLDAEAGDWVPGDVVPYSSIEASWTPRPESSTSAPRAAIGRYLEKPVLHYTIGTKVRPSVARSLEEFGVGDVLVHRDPPPFSPTMIRGVAQSQHDPDWAARQLGSGATKATLEAARRGAVADAAGPSFVAPLALDPAAWNRSGKTVGWDPKEAAARGVLDDLLDDDPFGLED